VVSTAPAPIQAPEPPASLVAAPPPAPTLKRSREEYEADLQALEADKTTVMQLEHTLYEARYALQSKTEAFHAKYYPQGFGAVPATAAKKAGKRRKRTAAAAFVVASGGGGEAVEGEASTKTLTRGWNNYQVFRKLCKELLPGSRAVRRAFNRALWDHQKQQMEAFFARHQVSPAACKAMADINAYGVHVTTTVRAAMETEMPFYVEMVRLYDANASDADNLTRLSSMCALQMLARVWTRDNVVPSQTLLMAVWTAFQGLVDLQCKALGIPTLFTETIPEGSLTPPLTEARLKHEVAPKLAASMPYLVSLFQAYTPSMGAEEVHALVQQARVAQSGGGGGSAAAPTVV
jgi:hypothetical protein